MILQQFLYFLFQRQNKFKKMSRKEKIRKFKMNASRDRYTQISNYVYGKHFVIS